MLIHQRTAAEPNRPPSLLRKGLVDLHGVEWTWTVRSRNAVAMSSGDQQSQSLVPNPSIPSFPLSAETLPPPRRSCRRGCRRPIRVPDRRRADGRGSCGRCGRSSTPATHTAQAPVPQASVSPEPRSQTRIRTSLGREHLDELGVDPLGEVRIGLDSRPDRKHPVGRSARRRT